MSGGVVVVSNHGDQTVTLIDANSHAVIATVPNIPGSRGLHGIGGGSGANPVAWIAGTDANLVTLLDVQSRKVLSQISVDHPAAIQGTQVATAVSVLKVTEMMLKDSGHQVTCASNGKHATKIAASQQVDLILIDVLMEGMSGIEAVRIIRAVWPELPVVFMTGFADQAEELRGENVLGKPFTPEKLVSTVEAVYEGRRETS